VQLKLSFTWSFVRILNVKLLLNSKYTKSLKVCICYGNGLFFVRLYRSKIFAKNNLFFYIRLLFQSLDFFDGTRQSLLTSKIIVVLSYLFVFFGIFSALCVFVAFINKIGPCVAVL